MFRLFLKGGGSAYRLSHTALAPPTCFLKNISMETSWGSKNSNSKINYGGQEQRSFLLAASAFKYILMIATTSFTSMWNYEKEEVVIFDSLAMDLTWQSKYQLWLLYGQGEEQKQICIRSTAVQRAKGWGRLWTICCRFCGSFVAKKLAQLNRRMGKSGQQSAREKLSVSHPGRSQ